MDKFNEYQKYSHKIKDDSTKQFSTFAELN